MEARGIELPIIMITAHGEVPMAARAMRARAFDFIQRPFSRHDPLERINQAMELDAMNHAQRQKCRQPESLLATLSTREREVLDMLIECKSTKVIAKHLNISSITVDNHRAKVLEKMQVDNVLELVRLIV